MALIGLFCFSTVLLFTSIEPFKTTGILLSICFLPGFCMFAVSMRKDILFEYLILAFSCSVGISSLLISVLLLLGIQINYIPIIIHTMTGIAILLHITTRKKNNAYTAVKVDKNEILFCLFSLFAILLMSIPFFIGVNRIGISGHAFHHSIMTTQIMNGIFPPENPGLGGTIIGYYWGFHALIAAITVNSNYQQIQIMFILNSLSLYIIFCISYSFAKAFDVSEIYRYVLPLAIIGLMRSDTGILILMKLFSGNLISLKELTASPVEPYEILSHWIRGLYWIDTRLFALHKLYNVSGMLLALSLCYAYLLILLKKDIYINKIDMTVIALIIAGSVINYPPLAIFILLHAPIWTCYILISGKGSLKENIRNALMFAIPYVVAGLIVFPYVYYIIISRNISSSGQGGIFSFDFYDQSLKNMVVFVIPLPVIVYGFWVAFRKLHFSSKFFHLSIGTILCLGLTIFTRWPFDNSYKFNYILLLYFSLFFVFALANLFAYVNSKWLKRLYVTIIIIFLLLPPLTVESSHIVSSFSTDYSYSFVGGHISYAQDNDKNEAYIWIRENTPIDALIMLSYTETNWPCCAFNNNYEPAAISERMLYVIKDTSYTTSNPEYANRVKFRQKLFENPEDPGVIDFFTSLHRSLYLLIEEDLDESKYFVEDRFKQFPLDPGKEFLLVFQNDKQRVYQIRLL